MTEPVEPPRAAAGMKFNAPPGWPPPPEGWTPPPDFQPDPSWPPAPDDWQWWAPLDESGPSASPDRPPAESAPTEEPPAHTAPFNPSTLLDQSGSDAPHFIAGPPPAIPPAQSLTASPEGSWIGRHKLLAAALVVVGLLVVGGATTGGIIYVNNRDDGSNTAASSPEPQTPSSPPAPSGSVDPKSPGNAAACSKAGPPHRKAVALLNGLRTKSVTEDAAVVAIPPIQAGLKAAGTEATGVLAKDLTEYAASLGALRTVLLEGKDPDQAEALVLVYAIVLKAACGL